MLKCIVSQVFDLAGEQASQVAQLAGHEGPVWQVTWAHPKFGSLLASCSFDHKVIVWKEAQESSWVQACTSQCAQCHAPGDLQKPMRQLPHMQAYSAPLHTASVNSVAFAPHELGLMLATASSDGSLSVLSYRQGDGAWSAVQVTPFWFPVWHGFQLTLA